MRTTSNYVHAPDGSCMSYKCDCPAALARLAEAKARWKACPHDNWSASGYCTACGISVCAAWDMGLLPRCNSREEADGR